MQKRLAFSAKTVRIPALASIIALSGSALAASPSIRSIPAAGCRGGDAVIATYPFSDADFRSKHALVVLAPDFLTLEGAKARLATRGYEVIGLINTGYFGSGTVASYYRSSRLGNQHSQNSALSPRGCLVYDARSGAIDVTQSTDENYRRFRSTPDLEVFCAGPQVLDAGQNVLTRQFCSERFNPSCREDGRDPGISLMSNYPRTASCVTASGDLKLFAFSSKQRKCGISGPEMVRRMTAEGCVSGLNHDGGGSTKFYGFDSSRAWTRKSVENRAVPIWAAVVKLPARSEPSIAPLPSEGLEATAQPAPASSIAPPRLETASESARSIDEAH